MFKVNNKDTRTTPLASFWCICCLLWTYFTPCSSVSIVNFECVNADWDVWKIYQIIPPINSTFPQLNPLSANPTKWSNKHNSSAVADELFECVWPFCGVALKRLMVNLQQTEVDASKRNDKYFKNRGYCWGSE